MADDGYEKRHIGPDADEQAAMLAELGYDSLDALIDAAVPAAIREDERLAFAAAAAEVHALEALRGVADRPRIPRHDHAPGHSTQRAGKSCVVHRVHAIPARDQSGSSRSVAQLPD